MLKDFRYAVKIDCRNCVREVFAKELYHLLSQQDIPVFQEIKKEGVLCHHDANAFKNAFEKTASHYENRLKDLENALASFYLPAVTPKERGIEFERIRRRIALRARKFLPKAITRFEMGYLLREYPDDEDYI